MDTPFSQAITTTVQLKLLIIFAASFLHLFPGQYTPSFPICQPNPQNKFPSCSRPNPDIVRALFSLRIGSVFFAYRIPPLPECLSLPLPFPLPSMTPLDLAYFFPLTTVWQMSFSFFQSISTSAFSIAYSAPFFPNLCPGCPSSYPAIYPFFSLFLSPLSSTVPVFPPISPNISAIKKFLFFFKKGLTIPIRHVIIASVQRVKVLKR